MTTEEFKALIEHALGPSADAEIDRSGRSEFDLAREAVRDLVLEKRAEELIGTLTDIGQRNRRRNVEWWLSFLDLFEEMKELMPRLGVKLLEFFLRTPPADLEARAYFLRFLVYLDAPVPWNDLPKESSVSTLAREAPLIVAESLVWAKKYAAALEILESTISTKQITSVDLKEIAPRWSDILGPSGDQFIGDIYALAARPNSPTTGQAHSAFLSFGKRQSTANSRFYRFRDSPPEATTHA